MKKFKISFIFILLIFICFKPPSEARRVRSALDLSFLSSIDWQRIETSIDRMRDRLCAEFIGLERYSFRDAIDSTMDPSAEEGDIFVLQEAPLKEDLESIRDLELDYEISIVFIPYIDTWIMVKGNGECAVLPYNLERIHKAGLISSFGHLHPGDFWPLPSPGDIYVAALYDGFEYVIAEAGIGVFSSDDIINPLTGIRWIDSPYDIETFSPDLNSDISEDKAMDIISEFFDSINFKNTILLWIEMDDQTIRNGETANIINNINNFDSLKRLRGLLNLAHLIGADALPVLEVFFKDPSAYIRTAALDVLLDIDLTEDDLVRATRVAESYLDDNIFSVRLKALDIIIQLSGVSGRLSEMEPLITGQLQALLDTEFFLSAFSEIRSAKGIIDNPGLLAKAVKAIATESIVEHLQFIVDSACTREEAEVELAFYCLSVIDKNLLLPDL